MLRKLTLTHAADRRTLVGACISAAVLAACGGPGALTSQSAPSNALPAQRQAARVAPASKTGPTLYVLNSGGGQTYTVSVYSAGGATLLRSISLAGRWGASLTTAEGHLFVSDGTSPGGPGLLNIYANRGAKVVQTLQQSHLLGLLTVDGFGNLFTMCAAARVCEYAKSERRVIKPRIERKIPKAGADALAADTAGDLAADGRDSVLIFAPDKTEPYWTITSGIDDSTALAFDSSGNLYVANFGGSMSDPGSIAVYAPGSTLPTRTITVGVVKPTALAFDASGNLYVLDYCIYEPSHGCASPPAVTVYAPGGNSPIRTISDGIDGDGALSLDGQGDLYVANFGPNSGSVTVYTPGGNSPIRTVTQGVQNPNALGVGP